MSLAPSKRRPTLAGSRVLRRARRAARHLPHYLALTALAILTVYPFWWTLVTALSTSGDVYSFPPRLWPTEPGLQNFVEVFQTIKLVLFYKNSILISAASVVGTLLICSLAAYPLATMQFPGRKLVFGAIVATLILPAEINFLVNFITIAKLQLADTLAGVVLPGLAGAVGIFLMKQAFEAVPRDLIDAARIDGANEWQIFWRVMLPLTKPALGALAILTLVSAWNQYIWPAVVLTSPDKFPLSVGVSYLAGTFGSKTSVVAAGAVLTVLPILIVFLFTQRFFLRGFEGAVK
ncbi:carbohydrate ABC transporter permease [Chitinimonas arctica]|uniref:Carbohydrate ABC transporter permease n=1 Tax=Chitinimonas arctica TaxID=2594795 RepID=A0A516SDU7_9NEIS|nr:carbohydrate ABC transporter permease [Chitinimonas arctica]QDQ26332.1 carbohydrate ABC transporter permease [Chitinimonas arctica]